MEYPMRTPYVGGNWKMNTSLETSLALAREIAAGASKHSACEVVVFPPFPFLLTVSEALGGSRVKLGAQDCYHEPNGAFTGEIALDMLKDCNVTHVLPGHSERRHIMGESDELVGKKTKAALDAGLTCVLCIGELLEQREAYQTDAVNESQARAALAAVTPDQMPKVILAYEPVWAIGTGKTATPDDAQAAHAAIRQLLANLYDQPIADATRIIYGGSVNPGNAAKLFAMPDIDGGLIGGASLIPDDFAAICHAC